MESVSSTTRGQWTSGRDNDSLTHGRCFKAAPGARSERRFLSKQLPLYVDRELAPNARTIGKRMAELYGTINATKIKRQSMESEESGGSAMNMKIC